MRTPPPILVISKQSSSPVQLRLLGKSVAGLSRVMGKLHPAEAIRKRIVHVLSSSILLSRTSKGNRMLHWNLPVSCWVFLLTSTLLQTYDSKLAHCPLLSHGPEARTEVPGRSHSRFVPAKTSASAGGRPAAAGGSAPAVPSCSTRRREKFGWFTMFYAVGSRTQMKIVEDVQDS